MSRTLTRVSPQALGSGTDARDVRAVTTLTRLRLKLVLAGAVATLGLGALPAHGATTTVTDLPRSVGELMNMNPMDVMRMMDPEQRGMVTKDQYMKFFSDLWDRMDDQRAGKVSRDAFMNGWAARNK